MLGVKQCGLVSAFPQSSGTAVLVVEILDVVAADKLHEFTDTVLAMGGEQEMRVLCEVPDYVNSKATLAPMTSI